MAFILEVNGRQPRQPEVPTLLGAASRSADPRHDALLPPDYVQLRQSVLLGPAARDASAGPSAPELRADDDEVLLLELVDGSTLVTSAAQLHASLQRARPELVDAERIDLEELNTQSAAASRGLAGDAARALVSKVFSLGFSAKPDEIIAQALKELAGDAALLGVSRVGTRVLMKAIESKVAMTEGLCSWGSVPGRAEALQRVQPGELDAAARKGAMLVFVHGTASSTLGSFGDLQSGEREVWSALERQFPGGIYGFEHRTLSRSPIENALELLEALPEGAEIGLVSHSRGGLVADLLCIRDFGGLIQQYQRVLPKDGRAGTERQGAVLEELKALHAEQRGQLVQLAGLIERKRVRVQRYLRVAAPANGTRLAGGNFDLFLSGILTLMGLSPWFFGNPLYSAFKRVVLEIARRRTDPHMVPGIEAMLPDSPLARLLRDAPVQPGIAMGLIAGDAEGGNALARLGVLLTDFLLFDQIDNDLVVDTPAMLAGIAPRAGARALLERSGGTTHFRYFANLDTRAALRDWLVNDQPQTLSAYAELPLDMAAMEARLARSLQEISTRRGAAEEAALPVVVLLPGVMGSHLHVRKNRVWLDPLDLLRGGLSKVKWGSAEVEADSLLALSYGDLAMELARTHRVVTFAYDWRQPLDVLGERLGALLQQLLQETRESKQPVRLLAHSMGGLVVRACIYRRRAVMDELMARDGARLVMLGTPHQGSHSMVQNLLGKGGMLRALAAMDRAHSLEELLGIVAGFRGALQLLPRPGFVDDFQSEGTQRDFLQQATWTALKPLVKDFWFGNGRIAVPEQAALDEGGWLWKQDNGDAPRRDAPSLPAAYEAKSVYVFGVARNTACGLRVEDEDRLKLEGTPRGDGTVTWASGRIGGVGRHYYMPAEHGNLCDTREYFGALVELLTQGLTSALSETPPVTRAAEPAAPVVYDAGPPAVLGDAALAAAAVGGKARTRVTARPRRRLEVGVIATDLRFLTQPVLVGHYENDPIAGPEGLIDRELLDGELSRRLALGLYAGPRGTATVVLRGPARPLPLLPGLLRGAVVAGLGSYEQPLNASDLTEAVRTGVLRLLLQVAEQLGADVDGADFEVPLASVILGYNSSASLSVAASVEALVRGVLEANARFHESTRQRIRVGRLDIVELYLDTAITAVYALRQHARPDAVLSRLAASLGTTLLCRRTLQQRQGVRQRLYDSGAGAYWPRLMITDADADEARRDPAAAGAVPASRRGAIATRLRYVYVGQRARAESVVQQRQPGLIEALVRSQIADPRWSEDIGRMLFQLMVPHDFKEAGRQLQRVVFVLDAYTANLPWELMFAADAQQGPERLPLALRTPMVRQLASLDFRRLVRPAAQRLALVVGNPSVQGFDSACLGADGKPARPLPPLPGAEEEAKAVAVVMAGLGHDVTRVIGADRLAVDVLAALYRHPWRLLHIAAHGVFDQPHRDGGRRSGVVLSDGLLITAAEIEAMETVPELVFLSCCHLGRVEDGRGSPEDAERLGEANKLAASVARELIRIGVRCVVVAGWAVNDALARQFGERFYTELLLNRQPFGDAVFSARRAVWETAPDDITWGAFQAYGDAAWRADPAADGRADDDNLVTTLDELLDELAARRAELARRGSAPTAREQARLRDAIKSLLRQRCPPDWLQLPQLQSALGATWADLGDFEAARQAYLCAVQAEDQLGRVPIRDIEQLANVESRLGERNGDEALIRLALRRLRDLDRLVGTQPDAAPALNPERCALRGAALKRLASLFAGRLLTLPDGADTAEAHGGLVQALWDSAMAYGEGEGTAGQSGFRPYNALNRLSLLALLFKADAATPPSTTVTEVSASVPPSAATASQAVTPEQALALARASETEAEQAQSRGGDVWTALMAPEARLVQALLEGRFDAEDGEAQAALAQRLGDYQALLQRLVIKPRERDSVLSHMSQLSRLADGLYRHGRQPALWHAATHLLALARALGYTGTRADRPPHPDAAGQDTAAADAADTGTGHDAEAAPAPAPRRAVAKKRRPSGKR